jgi:hypothetical protein
LVRVQAVDSIGSLIDRSNNLSTFGRLLADHFSLSRKSKDQRKASRKTIGESAWIRLDGGFAVRPCNVIDLSDTGVQITIDAAESVPRIFTFMISRDSGTGRRVRIKWRRGSQIGAEFI